MHTWDTIFRHYASRGFSRTDAARRADQWQKRQDPTRWSRCPSTHCERRQECASPNECSAAPAQEGE